MNTNESSSTPNTPANDGQILTDERIYEVIALLGAKNNLPSLIFAADHIAVSFARLIEADIRAALAEPIEQVANVIEYLMHNKHEIKWTDGDGEPFSSDAYERAHLCALIAGAKVGLGATLAAVPASEPVLLQWRVKDVHPHTVTTGQYSDWATCDKQKYDEIAYLRDNGYPHYEVRELYAAAPAPVSGMPDLASLQRYRIGFSGCLIGYRDGDIVQFADVERLLNPTGATK